MHGREILPDRAALLVCAAITAACFNPRYNQTECGVHGECPSGYLCIADVCESMFSGVRDMHVFDRAGLQAGDVGDMTVDAARAALTPNAYTYGGLVAHGLQGTKLWAHGDTSWSKLDGVTATGAGLWTGEAITTGSRLDYLGVVGDTVMTLWFEGEVWLDAGSSETFTLSGDDLAFVAIAQPGKTGFVRLTENNTSIAVPAAVSGWYPIRIGFSNGDGTVNLAFTHSDSAGTPIAWTRDRLRARTSELSGVLRTVYGHQILGGGPSVSGSPPPVAHLEQSDLLVDTTFPVAPQGAGTVDWSARYLGQVRVDQPGAYTLTISSDDGNRGRLGTGRGEAAWSRNAGVGAQDAITSIPAMLSAGWNDLTVDYNQVSGASRLQVQIQGPDFAGAIAIPRDRLRPVEPADDRLALGSDDTSHTVLDNGGPGMPGTAVMMVDAYTGAATEFVTAIDVTYEVNSPRWSDLRFDLESPIRRANIATGAGVPAGDSVGQTSIPAGAGGTLGQLLSGPARGLWRLHVYDVLGGGGDSVLKSAKLTLHTAGGPDKIARAASWTSQVIDAMTRVFAIDSVTWDERVPDGAAIQVRLATCQQADCSDAAWSDPVTRGKPFAVAPPARYLQLRVDMTSNGTLGPELQSLAVMFQREPG